MTTWRWKPPRCGNYLLHWKCDIGGDVPEFWRNFSVVDDTYAVMILNSTSHRPPRPEPDFHELHLPFSPWWEARCLSATGRRSISRGPSRGARQFGDDLSLLIFTSGEYVPGGTIMLYDEPEAVQQAVLGSYSMSSPCSACRGPS